MVDKLAVGKILAEQPQQFMHIENHNHDFYFVSSIVNVQDNIYALEMTDQTFKDFCQEKYRTRNRNKQAKQIFDIFDAPHPNLFLRQCRVISFLKDLNLVFVRTHSIGQMK